MSEEYSEEESSLDRDALILHQQEMIKRLATEYSEAITKIKEEFAEYVRRSESLQEQMLDRIRELKEQKPARKTNRSEVRSSLYSNLPKHPRKTAPSTSYSRK